MSWTARALGRVDDSFWGRAPLSMLRVLAVERPRTPTSGYRDAVKGASAITRLVYTGATLQRDYTYFYRARAVELGGQSSVEVLWEHEFGELRLAAHIGDAVLLAGRKGVWLLDMHTGQVRWSRKGHISRGLFLPVRFDDELLVLLDPAEGFEVEHVGSEKQMRPWVRVSLKSGEVVDRGQTTDVHQLHRMREGGVEVFDGKLVEHGSEASRDDGWEQEIELGHKRGGRVVWLARTHTKQLELAVALDDTVLVVHTDDRFDTYQDVSWMWLDGLLVVRAFLTKGKRKSRFVTAIVDVHAWVLLGKLGDNLHRSELYESGKQIWRGFL